MRILVKEKYIKTLKTYEQILRPLIAELNALLDDSILVEIDGNSTIRLYGALATVSADNLPAHALAGFKKFFNSGRMCCYCVVLNENKVKLKRHKQVLALNQCI